MKNSWKIRMCCCTCTAGAFQPCLSEAHLSGLTPHWGTNPSYTLTTSTWEVWAAQTWAAGAQVLHSHKPQWLPEQLPPAPSCLYALLKLRANTQDLGQARLHNTSSEGWDTWAAQQPGPHTCGPSGWAQGTTPQLKGRNGSPGKADED